MMFATIKKHVTILTTTIKVRTNATLSAVLSHTEAFSPSALAQINHAVFIYNIGASGGT